MAGKTKAMTLDVAKRAKWVFFSECMNGFYAVQSVGGEFKVWSRFTSPMREVARRTASKPATLEGTYPTALEAVCRAVNETIETCDGTPSRISTWTGVKRTCLYFGVKRVGTRFLPMAWFEAQARSEAMAKRMGVR